MGIDKDYTFVGPRGMIVVDYVIHVSTPDVFLKTEQFIVANFTDHAPLYIRLNQYMIHQAQSVWIENSCDMFPEYPVWDPV